MASVKVKSAAKRTAAVRRSSGRRAPSLGAAIVQGLREAVAYERGEPTDVTVTRATHTDRSVSVTPPAEIGGSGVARLRATLKLSQAVFAKALNVKPDTVRSWEQGKRVPDGAAVRLLELAREHPEWVLRRVVARKAAKPARDITEGA